MAITLEEEKKPVNWIAIIVAGIIIVMLFATGYYLFFKQPQLIEVVIPPRLQDLSTLSGLRFNPEEVVGPQSVFGSLRDFSLPLAEPFVGRANPFKPF